MSVQDSDPIEAEIAVLPLDGWHRGMGARMVPFAGYWMPIQYEGIIAEHQWTRSHAGLFDVSHMGQVMLSGPDADLALEALIPADVLALRQGRVRYSLLLDEDGGILDDLMVTRTADGLYLVVNGATKIDDIVHLRENLPDEIVVNHQEDQALLALQGPEAADVLARIVPGVEALGFMQAAGFAWGGTPLWISRSGYTGEDGFEISIAGERAIDLAEVLCAEPEVRPIGLGARDSLRLEAGLPLYGHDLDPRSNPVTAALDFAISKRRREEGGFPGAETILAQLRDGPPVLRVGLAIVGRQPVREGAEIFDGDVNVGVVTSGGFSPSLGVPIAMGTVSAGHAALGHALQIELRGKRIDATVASMPFVPHRYHRKGVNL